jgi:hypothetical protein
MAESLLALDDDTVKELAALEGLSPEQLQGIVTAVFSFLSKPQGFDVGAAVIAFSEHHGIKNQTRLKLLFGSVINFFQACVRITASHTTVAAELKRLGLAQEKAISLAKAWRKANAVMSKASVAKTMAVNELVDMEWKFGVTASTNDAAQVGSTFLQLKLVLNKVTGPENVYMELTLPQFYDFLHEMERCKATMDAFN